MRTVISKDKTPIVYEAAGHGPPLLLVHGGGSTPERWRPILPRFESDFTVYRISRRGVGKSGDAVDYTVERQAEDIAAVVDAIGKPVDVLGHSFGALCTLESALLTTNIRRLILYEAPILPMFPPGSIDRLEALLNAGDRGGVWAQDATQQIHHALCNSRVVAMPGQQHIAMDTTPDLFAREVMAFLKA